MKTLKLKSILFGLTAMMAVALFMVSCEQEFIREQANIELSSPSIDEIQSEDESMWAIFAFAQNLSIAVNSDETILEDIEKRCNVSNEKGHYEKELFYHLDKDKKIGKAAINTFSSILKSQNSTLNSRNSEHDIEDYICEIPGLSILLEGNTDSDKYSKKIYVDDGFDDSDENAHIKYFENGVMGSHAISQVPDAKAFVVRISEAYIPKDDPIYTAQSNFKDTNIKNIGYTDCGEEINIVQKSEVLTDMSMDIDARGLPVMCERDLNGNLTENISLFSTTDIHEGWRGKHGEFRFYVIWADDVQYQYVNGALQVTGNPLSSARSGTYPAKKNELVQVNYGTIMWDLATDGDEMKYVIYESDGGGTRQVDVTLGGTYDPPPTGGTTANISATIPIVYNNGDDEVGEQIVEYCQDVGASCCSLVIQGGHTDEDGGTISSTNQNCCNNDQGRTYTPGGGVTFFINND